MQRLVAGTGGENERNRTNIRFQYSNVPPPPSLFIPHLPWRQGTLAQQRAIFPTVFRLSNSTCAVVLTGEGCTLRSVAQRCAAAAAAADEWWHLRMTMGFIKHYAPMELCSTHHRLAMDIDMPLADIAKKLKKDNKKNKKGPKPGKNAAKNKQGKGNTPKKGTPNKVKGGVGKVHKFPIFLISALFFAPPSLTSRLPQTPQGQKSPKGQRSPMAGKSPKGQVRSRMFL